MEKMPRLDYQSFLAPAMTAYLAYLGRLGFSTVGPAHNLHRIDRFLIEQRVCGLHQIDAQLAMRLREQCQGRVRAATIRHYLQTWRGLCSYLVRAGQLSRNPLQDFPSPRPEPCRPFVFSPGQLGALFSSLKAQARKAPHAQAFHRALNWYTLYHLIYACGLRVSEAIALRAGDYSHQAATLFIRPSKFGKDRLLPIGGKAALNLNNLLALRQGLFPRAQLPDWMFLHLPAKRPYSRRWASARFRELLRQLGIYRSRRLEGGCMQGTPHLHELRRSFAVHRLIRWYRQGEDVQAKLPLLATYMGHADWKYTLVYLTLTRQLLDQAAHRFAAGFDRLDWIRHVP